MSSWSGPGRTAAVFWMSSCGLLKESRDVPLGLSSAASIALLSQPLVLINGSWLGASAQVACDSKSLTVEQTVGRESFQDGVQQV